MSQMNDNSAADSYNSDGLPPEFRLGENDSFLTSPYELKMASSIDEDFPEEGYKLTTLKDLIDSESTSVRYGTVCLFRITYYMYRPEQDPRGRPWYGNSTGSDSQKNKNSDIERVIWVMDVFGHSGQNMAVVLLTRRGVNQFFNHSIGFCDSGHMGES